MMKPLGIQDIARAIGARCSGEQTVGAICTDSRRLTPGCLFVALKGDKFDGHAYIAAALEQGAAYAVASDKGDYPPGRVLYVEDTRTALLQIAHLYRMSLPVKVLGITGSVGKTTTKEMCACALSTAYSTLKNEANLNNEIGMSQTILQLTGDHQCAVLEMGMDGPGQIAPLSHCARPDAAIVTNIGISHMEMLGSRENIRREKLSIQDGVVDGGSLILCGDDPMLKGVTSDRLDVLFFGIDNPNCMVRAKHIKEFSTHTTFEVVYDGRTYDATIPVMGRHNVYNALAAITAAVCFSVRPQDAIAALAHYKTEGMRQNIVKHNAFTVVEDCYNASPDSMRAALLTLGKLECDGKRIAVLSDMLELGAVEREAHYDTGRMAVELGVDILCCTGELSGEYVRGARDAGMEQVHYFEDREGLFRFLKDTLHPGDVVWFKASRVMKLEEVIKRIYEEL